MTRKTDRYDWQSDDIAVSTSIELPGYLKEVVSNTPSDSQEIGQYLQKLVKDRTITIDDVTFLLESGVLE